MESASTPVTAGRERTSSLSFVTIFPPGCAFLGANAGLFGGSPVVTTSTVPSSRTTVCSFTPPSLEVDALAGCGSVVNTVLGIRTIPSLATSGLRFGEGPVDIGRRAELVGACHVSKSPTTVSENELQS